MALFIPPCETRDVEKLATWVKILVIYSSYLCSGICQNTCEKYMLQHTLLPLQCSSEDYRCGMLHWIGIVRASTILSSTVNLSSVVPGFCTARAAIAHFALRFLYMPRIFFKFMYFILNECLLDRAIPSVPAFHRLTLGSKWTLKGSMYAGGVQPNLTVQLLCI